MRKPASSILALMLLTLILIGCEPTSVPTSPPPPPPTATATPSPPPTATATPVRPTPTHIAVIHLRTTAFRSGGDFPEKYTCDGEDVSPPLAWDDPPPGTQGFAIILDNPYATTERGWVHWILFNIPADKRALPEAVPPVPELDDGSLHGRNSETWLRYTGPCPPFPQRYYFRLYALDTILELEAGASKEEVMQAMQGHILAQGKLEGMYMRK